MYYESDCDPAALSGQDDRRDRLRQPGARARPQQPRLRQRRGRRRPAGLARLVGGERRRAARGHRGRRDGAGRRGDGARARPHPGGPLPRRDRAPPAAGLDADVRARVQHPLRRRSLPGDRRRRRDDRAQGPRPSRAPPVRAGHRRARPDRGAPGRDRRRAAAGAGVRPRHRLRPRRPDRDDVPRGDRDRPVRRADGAVRRHHAARPARHSRRWSRRATSRRSPTSSACTS